MTKVPIHQKDTGTVNTYAPNVGEAKYKKLILCSTITVAGT